MWRHPFPAISITGNTGTFFFLPGATAVGPKKTHTQVGLSILEDILNKRA